MLPRLVSLAWPRPATYSMILLSAPGHTQFRRLQIPQPFVTCSSPPPHRPTPHGTLVFLPRLMGSTTFTGNRGYRGGAIYSSAGDEDAGTPAAITTYPTDTVFIDNTAEVRITAAPLVSVLQMFSLMSK